LLQLLLLLLLAVVVGMKLMILMIGVLFAAPSFAL
jgi:hypothetical protein